MASNTDRPIWGTRKMTSPAPDEEPQVRELNPVTFSLTHGRAFDQDWSPQPVKVGDVHPSEVDGAPKVDAASSAQESATPSSDPASPSESGATAEKANTSSTPAEVPPGLEDLELGSPEETSAGASAPPVVTPPSPPAPIRSSRSAGK
jgi:hypothetical protein